MGCELIDKRTELNPRPLWSNLSIKSLLLGHNNCSVPGRTFSNDVT